MIESFRRFTAGPDPFGRTWQVDFRWHQNAITIRHCDAIDVKFYLILGEDVHEKVVGIMHPDLLALSERANRPVTDAWVNTLAALHIKHMIETDQDMEKTIVTPSLEDLERYNAAIEEWREQKLVQR